jgi:dipeptidyl aminopeptidase/acylaminoacyl peptidase
VNPDHRFADFAVHPFSPHLLVSILEDHTGNVKPTEVRTTLVTINTLDRSVHPLISGSDFYSSATFNPEGDRIAWVQWDQPMPWDGSEVHVAECSVSKNDDGMEVITVKNERKLKGVWGKESAVHPKWLDKHRLLFNSDETGFQNPYIVDLSSNLIPQRIFGDAINEDFSPPSWLLGGSFSAVLSPTHVLFTALRDGKARLYNATRLPGSEEHWKKEEIETPFVTITNLRRAGENSALFVGTRADTPAKIVSAVLMLTSATSESSNDSYKVTFTELLSDASSNASSQPVDKKYFSIAHPLTFQNVHGEDVHALFYPPTNPDFVPSSKEEKAPCILSIHGGPTGSASPGLNMKIQFFTSRGLAWADLDYGGSSGYGRRYMCAQLSYLLLRFFSESTMGYVVFRFEYCIVFKVNV